MGGNATFSGTTYQAKLIAFIYAHLLTQSRLGWLHSADDTPVGISGETRGPGDDVRVELRSPYPAFEVQAKHNLSAGGSLIDLFSKAQQRADPTSAERVVIVVNRDSSRKVHLHFARDLDRLRSGRTDSLKGVTQTVLQALPDGASFLARVHVIKADLDEAYDPERKFALGLIESALEDPTRATAAWSILVEDANNICARRQRRTRKELVDLLEGASIRVKPPRPDEKWFRQLEFTKRLVDRRHDAAALKVLSDLEQELREKQVDAAIWYKLFQHRATASLHMARYEDAIGYGLRALDFDRDGVHAHQTVALAAMLSGNLDLAHEHANRAVTDAPNEDVGWIALAQVEAAKGDDHRAPTRSIAESAGYRMALAQIAVNQAEWETCLELTTLVLDSGNRAPEVLFLRCQALLGIIDRDRSTHACAEVERVSTELIDLIHDEAHPFTARSLVMRAKARRLLGKAEKAEEDLQRASDLSPEDPELIYQKARASIDAGDYSTAMHILRHPAVAENPMLLTLRATLQADDAPSLARADLDASLSLLPEAPDPVQARLGAAEVAIQLGDFDLAKRLLEESTPGSDAPTATWHSRLRGRLAFTRGDSEQGALLIRRAAELSPERRVELLTELASHLCKINQFEAAVSALTDLSPDELTDAGRRILVNALIELHRLADAQAIIDPLAAHGGLPDWALHASVEIALRQEDLSAAVDRLMELVERTVGAVGVRFELARQLVALGRVPEAAEHVEVLRQRHQEDLTPAQTMLLAQLMHAIQPSRDALELAFRAFRAGPADPQLHRAFIGLFLLSDVEPEIPEAVGPDTHVRLTRRDAEKRSYTILADPPFDPLRDEISPDDAETLGLLGTRVGAVIVLHKGSWREEEWTVSEILTAAHGALHDAMVHYEERFPSEPFFLARFSVGEGTSVKDFAPLIASAEARRHHVRKIVEGYRTQVLPLGMVSDSLGVSIPDLLTTLGRDELNDTPLYVEWSDRAGIEGSLRSARIASHAVLTSSALWTIVDLDLLGVLAQQYRLVAPISLEAELKRLVAGAERELAEGKKSLAASEDGTLSLQDIEPGHLVLQDRLAKRRALFSAIASVEVKPRPLETIGAHDSQDEQLRSVIGPSSFDAVRLAASLDFPLLADDLGLRKIARAYGVSDSFSTVALLVIVAEAGLVTGTDRDRQLLVLVERGYAFIPPSVSLVVEALKSTNLGQTTLAKVFSLLASPLLDLSESARIAGQVLKRVATSTIQVQRVSGVAGLALEGMALRWPARLCAQTLVSACSETLMLLPDKLQDVRLAAKTFVKEREAQGRATLRSTSRVVEEAGRRLRG